MGGGVDRQALGEWAFTISASMKITRYTTSSGLPCHCPASCCCGVEVRGAGAGGGEHCRSGALPGPWGWWACCKVADRRGCGSALRRVGRFVEARVSQLADGARAGASLDIVPGGEVPEAVVVLGAGSIGMSAGGSIRQDAP